MNNSENISKLTTLMIEYYRGDPKRIQHFLKVHAFAKLIGEKEIKDTHVLYILESAAVLHDIGIKIAEQKFGSSDGKLQEQEGPAPARKMLEGLNYDVGDIKRICYLIAHHHTYENITEIDYQVLVEADFLVNLYEDGCSKEAVLAAYNGVFKTKTGKEICKTMFGL